MWPASSMISNALPASSPARRSDWSEGLTTLSPSPAMIVTGWVRLPIRSASDAAAGTISAASAAEARICDGRRVMAKGKRLLHPADTGYLYFVADGSGGHAFARTLEEHGRNVARWRRVKDKPPAAG